MRISDWSSDVCSSDLPSIPYRSYRLLLPLRRVADLVECHCRRDRLAVEFAMQDRRAPAGERALEGGRERLGRLHRLAMTAEGAGERGEIGAGERCRGDPAGEGAFLVHPDRTIDAVVPDRKSTRLNSSH